jgi:hypothetical protein
MLFFTIFYSEGITTACQIIYFFYSHLYNRMILNFHIEHDSVVCKTFTNKKCPPPYECRIFTALIDSREHICLYQLLLYLD